MGIHSLFTERLNFMYLEARDDFTLPQVMMGCGRPEAEHVHVTVSPSITDVSSGVFVNLGLSALSGK